MPFAIVCQLCGRDEKGHPITAFRDQVNDPAWIHYALHIVEMHQDNFRIHWAMHALDDKKIPYNKPDLTPKIPSEPVSKIRSLPDEKTVTEYLARKQQQTNTTQNITEKPKISIFNRFKRKSNKAVAEDLLPQENNNNSSSSNNNDQSHEYATETENPFNNPDIQAAIKRVAAKRRLENS